jgi:hypothetical protein
MNEPVRIELIPRMVAGVTQSDPASTMDVMGEVQDGWLARINGTVVPVVTYGIEPAAEGAQALVSLLILADSLTVGDSSTAAPEPQVRPAAPVKNERPMWGSAGQPDARERIPGWAPGQGSTTTATRDGVNQTVDAGVPA